MLTRSILATLLLASSFSYAQSVAPLPPSNFKIGPPETAKNYPAIDPNGFPVVVTTQPNQIVRDKPPVELFGFNLIWDRFQAGYWRNGRVRPEVVEWLKPFKGSLYRYPGGLDSNYFLWDKSIGPVANRPAQQNKFQQWIKPEFGFDEYISLMKEIGGHPLVVANVYGTHTERWSAAQATEYNRRWVEYANAGAKNQTNQGACAVGSPCPLTLWEIGNETDWEAGFSVDRYVESVKSITPVLKAADPAIDFIAHTKTAPWNDTNGASTYNTTIGNQLRSTINNYAFHPYYDGRSISDIEQNFINNLVVAKVNDPGSKVYITEHALWPYRPNGASDAVWQQYWPTTGDMGGALSTSDFILMAMNRSDVGGAVWHALGLDGPWMLFHVGNNDSVYPNVVYWGMRAMREAVLDQVVKVTLKTPNSGAYYGGYDVRSAVMRNTAGTKYSLMAVNRSGAKLPLALSVPTMANTDVKITTRTVSASGPRVGNTNDGPFRVQQQTASTTNRFGNNGVMALELPPYAVISFVIERQ